MALQIPNLFGAAEKPARLYSLLLCKLAGYGKFAEIVDAARKIRQHAKRAGLPRNDNEVLSTYHFEKEALWYLKEHRAAWQQQLRFETDAFGKAVNLNSDRVSREQRCYVSDQRARLHFACGRFSYAAQCLEFALKPALEEWRDTSELLPYITNDDKYPSHPARFTLRHAYEAMDKRLSEWPDWQTLIQGLKGSLLRVAGTTRKQLLAHDSLLNAVRNKDSELRSRNVPVAPVNPPKTRSKYDEQLDLWFPFLRELSEGK